MKVNTLNKQLRSFANKKFGQGASEIEIKDAELILGVALAGGYRRFLREFGWGCIEYFEIFGLGADVPHYLNLIHMTQRERFEMEPAIPNYLVPLMNDGGGNHYCLDTRQIMNGECPVAFWDHESGPNQHPSLIATSFDLWLVELLDSLDKNA